MPHKLHITTNNRLYTFIFTLVLFGAIVLGYQHTLHSPFVLDDGTNILHNPYIQIDNLSLESLRKVFSSYQPSNSRPVANLSFALNYLVSGYNLAGFHLVNILIHALTAFILFHLFSFYFLKAGCSEKDSLKLAACAALLWAVNPLQTNAVTYIIQRMTSLSTLFFSASLLAYIHARTLQSPDRNEAGSYKTVFFFLLSLTLWLLAMKTKEIAAIMPVILFLHELFFFRGVSRDSTRKYTYVVYCAIFLILLLLYIVFAELVSWQGILNSYASRDFTLGERLLTEGRVVVRYMSLFLLPLPSRMTVYYDYPLSTSLIDPVSTLLSFFLLIGMIAFSLGRTKQYPLLSFGLLWTLCCLVIESTVLPLELIFEHRFYLPSMGFSLAIVALTYHLFRNKKIFNIFWILVLCVLITMTYIRNQDWRSELSLNLDAAEKAPHSVRAINNLAGAYMKAGEYDKGKATLERALALNNDNVVVLTNLFMLSVDMRMTAQAEYYLKRMNVAINEGHFICKQSSNLLLATEILVRSNRFADAIVLLETLKSCREKNAVYYDNLALCYAKTGNHRKAIENFNKALERNHKNPYTLFSLARSYMLNKDWGQSAATLKRLHNTVIPDELKPHVDKLEKYLLKK